MDKKKLPVPQIFCNILLWYQEVSISVRTYVHPRLKWVNGVKIGSCRYKRNMCSFRRQRVHGVESSVCKGNIAHPGVNGLTEWGPVDTKGT